MAVIGSGSWATALVKILAEGHTKVRWFVRNEAAVQHILTYGHNPAYLADVQHNLKKVRPTSNLKKAVKDAQVVVLAVPSAFLETTLGQPEAGWLEGKVVVSAIKGLLPDSHLLVTDWLEQAYHVQRGQMAVISGPCHAEEVALERLSYLTIGAHDLEVARQVGQLLNCRYIKTIESEDIYGVEYSAIMKNIAALACGICHGLSYGDNFQSVLVTNAMREIRQFLEIAHPAPRDVTDSAYLGDLLVTCYSQFSRNRTFGTMIGRGYSVASAQMQMKMIAEGYYAAAAVQHLNAIHMAHMPITDAVYRILYKGEKPREVMEELQPKLR